jgi:flagellar protein FliT
MLTSQEILALYEAMAALTGQMLAASQCGDWDQLIALEQRCAAHVECLKLGEPALALTGASRVRKVECIGRMLADDRKIRDLTMPWMARLSALMQSAGTERRLADAYGSA